MKLKTRLRKAIREVVEELFRAEDKHGPMRSPHEGWAIIAEELDELWEEVRKKDHKRSKKLLRGEAKQTAATAIRFMLDLT